MRAPCDTIWAQHAVQGPARLVGLSSRRLPLGDLAQLDDASVVVTAAKVHTRQSTATSQWWHKRARTRGKYAACDNLEPGLVPTRFALPTWWANWPTLVWLWLVIRHKLG